MLLEIWDWRSSMGMKNSIKILSYDPVIKKNAGNHTQNMNHNFYLLYLKLKKKKNNLFCNNAITKL